MTKPACAAALLSLCVLAGCSSPAAPPAPKTTEASTPLTAAEQKFVDALAKAAPGLLKANMNDDPRQAIRRARPVCDKLKDGLKADTWKTVRTQFNGAYKVDEDTARALLGHALYGYCRS